MYTVLIIESDRDNGKLLREISKRAGLAVEIVTNQQEAVIELVCKPNHYDGLVVNLGSDHHDDLRGALAMQRLFRSLPPVVFTTASDVSEQQVRKTWGEECGFLRKPFSPAALVNMLHAALQQPEVA